MPKNALDLTNFEIKIPKHIKNFDPSYVTRYLITAKLITEIERLEKTKLKILDVGGYNGAISNFFPDHDITVIDIIEDKKAKNYVQANGSKMPFADNTFDLIISCDALEHVVPNERKDFIQEMTRVTKNYLLLCAPFGTPSVESAELLGDSFYQGMTNESYVWLKEHREYKLPKKRWLSKILTESYMNTTTFSHTSIDLWTLMLGANFFLAGNVGAVDRKLANKLRSVNETYLNKVAHFDFPKEGYRTFFVSSKKTQPTVKLPTYNQDAVMDFMVNDIKTVGVVTSKLTQQIGTLFEQKKDMENQRDILAAELAAIKNSRKYRLANRIAAPKGLMKKIRKR